MTALIEAEKLERYYRAERAAWQTLDEASRAGLEWMAANEYRLPPQEYQDRLERAHADWVEIRKVGPFGELPVLDQAPQRG